MQELYIDERTCLDEAGNRHTFQYFLLTDKPKDSRFTCNEYGVMVRSCAGEQLRIPRITADHTRITALLTLLCEHGVSPVHLRDVIEDWL